MPVEHDRNGTHGEVIACLIDRDGTVQSMVMSCRVFLRRAEFAFIAWLVKAGSIVNFISESVMVGFKCGVALFLASTQLPKLFGVHGAHGASGNGTVRSIHSIPG